MGSASFDTSANLRVAVGDPEQPLAFIEVRMDGSTTPDDQQFVENVAGIVLSAAVRFGAEDAIRHQAMHDPLTGLPNRALFNDRLEHALSRRSRNAGYVAVMIVDLDGFKNVNDGLGHHTGDALLIAVANRFSVGIRGFDTIARLGGDEFAILFDELDVADLGWIGCTTGSRFPRRPTSAARTRGRNRRERWHRAVKPSRHQG